MFQEFVMKIKKQFLCQTPITEIALDDLLDNINEENLDQLLHSTINDEDNLKYPIKVEYQKAFIKRLINLLQKRNIEVNDNIYDALGKLLNHVQEDYYYKHYVAENKRIVLRENINIISNGTTGLCSWQASVLLSEWVLNNKRKFDGTCVLELGSGVGLTGLVIALCCTPKEVFLSDCHESVLNNLRMNVNLNMPQEISSSSEYLQTNIVNDMKVNILNLPWEDVDDKKVDLIKPNLIIAADVIYDKDLFMPFLNALECFVAKSNVEIILSCTERNEETLTLFLELARSRHFVVQEMQGPVQNNFVWSQSTAIKLYLLKK